jgi:hypothetical protein
VRRFVEDVPKAAERHATRIAADADAAAHDALVVPLPALWASRCGPGLHDSQERASLRGT